MAPRLSLNDIPGSTPLAAFVAWNKARWRRDRRYVLMGDVLALLDRFGDEGRAAAITHLAVAPMIRWRWREHRLCLRQRRFFSLSAPSRGEEGRAEVGSSRSRAAWATAHRRLDPSHPKSFSPLKGGEGLSLTTPATGAAGRLVDAQLAAMASTDAGTHAALFRAFEELAAHVDLDALASSRPRHRAVPPAAAAPRRILVIKLSALGDFVQALGPAAAIRAHHPGDHITLLTTRAFAGFAERTGYFDAVVIDRRPKLLDIRGALALRRTLRGGGFDRVYDLQTSDRSSLYAWLWRPGPVPQWSGIAWRCSHPHANLARDPQHTIDKQAEQLLMAGIWPVPLPVCPAPSRSPPELLVPEAAQGRRFVLLIPGSSPHHRDKRWPAARYGALAQRLAAQGLLPVVLGGKGEEDLARTIQAACPSALDLVGRTDLDALADLARAASLTVGNDTGVTHIAAAGRHPVVVLFSNASEPSRCAPRGGVVHVLAVPDLGRLTLETVFAQVRLAMADSEG